MQSFRVADGRVHQLRYTPDGRWIVVDVRGKPRLHPAGMGYYFSPGYELVWWDWAKGEAVRRFRLRDSLYGPGGAQQGVADRTDWQPDAPALDVSFVFAPFRVATAWEWTNKEDGTCVYDADAQRSLYLNCPYKTHVQRVALAPDGRSIATATVGDMDGRGYLEIWDIPDETPVRSEVESEPWSWEQEMIRRRVAMQQNTVDLNINPVAFAFDGRFAVAGGGQTVAVWDRLAPPVVAEPAAPDGRLDWVPRHAAIELTPGFEVSALALGSGQLAVAGGGLAVWNPDPRAWTPFPAPTDIAAVCFDPTGRRLLIGRRSHEVEIWDAGGERTGSLQPGIGPVTAVAFAPDGLTCAAAGTNGRVVLWDVDE